MWCITIAITRGGDKRFFLQKPTRNNHLSNKNIAGVKSNQYWSAIGLVLIDYSDQYWFAVGEVLVTRVTSTG